MEKIWITALNQEKETIGKLMAVMKQYGLNADGHFWIDDLKKMAWLGHKERVVEDGVALWVTLGDKAALEKPDMLYGLSMVAMAAHAVKGDAFPVVIVQTDRAEAGAIDAADALPTPLARATILELQQPNLGAKLVTKVHAGLSGMHPEYHLDVQGFAEIGLWFEVGPGADGEWEGAIVGVSGGEIELHAVGERGRIPERSVLNYPIQGMTLRLGEREYIAWGVKNPLDSGSSYYVKVKGTPDALLFGPFPDQDDAETYSMTLK